MRRLIWCSRQPVHEILDHLPPGARVLDLGARGGSFRASDYPALIIVSADLAPSNANRNPVAADAAALPFAARSFHAVIANHSLEHFDCLKPALQEIGRVVRADGAVYVAVPDATTFGDRLYRKLLPQRGGHVNLFGSQSELATMLSWYFGMPLTGSRVLVNSFVWLNRRNVQGRYFALPEPLLLAFVRVLRLFGERPTLYGWALWFGRVAEPVSSVVRHNVCIRCGAAQETNAPRCPDCGARSAVSS